MIPSRGALSPGTSLDFSGTATGQFRLVFQIRYQGFIVFICITGQICFLMVGFGPLNSISDFTFKILGKSTPPVAQTSSLDNFTFRPLTMAAVQADIKVHFDKTC